VNFVEKYFLFSFSYHLLISSQLAFFLSILSNDYFFSKYFLRKWKRNEKIMKNWFPFRYNLREGGGRRMKSRRGKSLKSNPHPSTFELAAAERGPCGRKTVEIDGDRVNRKTSPVQSSSAGKQENMYKLGCCPHPLASGKRDKTRKYGRRIRLRRITSRSL
jgi:hypothetical protein